MCDLEKATVGLGPNWEDAPQSETKQNIGVYIAKSPE